MYDLLLSSNGAGHFCLVTNLPHFELVDVEVSGYV